MGAGSASAALARDIGLGVICLAPEAREQELCCEGRGVPAGRLARTGSLVGFDFLHSDRNDGPGRCRRRIRDTFQAGSEGAVSRDRRRRRAQGLPFPQTKSVQSAGLEGAASIEVPASGVAGREAELAAAATLSLTSGGGGSGEEALGRTMKLNQVGRLTFGDQH